MNYKHLLIKIMRITFLQLFIILSLFGSTMAKTLKAQAVLNTKISINQNGVPLGTVLKLIEKEYDINFIYSPQVLDAKQKVNVFSQFRLLSDVLHDLLTPAGLTYDASDNVIAISKAKDPKSNDILASVTITGKVVAENNGDPLPGVTVKVKGTNIATSTNVNGIYSIDAPSGDNVLVFSFVGFDTQEIVVNEQKIINVLLKTTPSNLNEVVVIGYGTQKRLNVTAAISSAPMKELREQPVFNVLTAMQGKIPGVSIKSNSGGPGATPVIRIRGFGSITAGNTPLIVVDGNIANTDIFQTISADEIESIDILKDASSAAIYGSKGSNGVVMVTTKRGKTGAPKIDLGVYSGFQYVTKKLELLTAQQFAEFSKDAANNAYLDAFPTASLTDANSLRSSRIGGNARFGYPRGESGINFDDPAAVAALPNTNYQDLIFQRAPITNYSVGVSGGTDKVKYLVNGSVLEQGGIIITSGIKRYTLRANVDVQATSKLKVGLNINPTYRVQHTVNADGHWADNGVINAALATLPFQPVYDANGNYTTVVPLATPFQWATPTNAVANATEKKRRVGYSNLISNAYAEYSFLDNLKYRASGNVNIVTTNTDAYNTSRLPLNGLLPPNAATGSSAFEQTGSWLINQTLNYTKSFKSGHYIDALIGMEATKFQVRNTNAAGNTFPNDVVQTLNAAATPTSATSSVAENASHSYFARVSYNYKSRYLAYASIRRDGSSIFGSENRYGVFPAGSLGWNVSEEDFAKQLTWLSNAKLRVSYGLSGNNAFNGNYPYATLLGTSNYAFNNILVNGVIPSTLGNVRLGWEKNEQLDIGLELGVLQNRISITADLYNRITKDLLFSVQVPTLTGYGSSFQNIGRMRNRGIDLGLNTNNLIGKFTWTTNANISFNRNVVLALGPTGAPQFNDAGVGATNVTMIGLPIGNFYGYRQLGIFKDQADLNSYPHDATAKPGDVKFEDVNNDGKIDATDRTTIGNNQPQFTYGLTNTFSFKGIELSVAFQGVQGGQILNLSRRFFDNLEGSQNQLAIAASRWRSPSDPGNGTEPRANARTTGNNNAVSSRWLESASYLRLQNVNIGYQLPVKWVQKAGIAKARVYFSGQNLYTWSKYLNYNPDVSNYDGPLTSGVDYGSYPLYRTLTLGLNLTF
jgi:TonB-linked SusC/RagA family outer membrane protein